MKGSKEYTTIKLSKDLNDTLLILKIKLGYKSVNDLLKFMIKKYKEETK